MRNPATVGRFESGEYPIRRGDVAGLLDLYGVSDKQWRESLLKLSAEIWYKGWWDGYADDVDTWVMDYAWLESRVDEIRAFDITAVHSLLQTCDYADALIRTADPDASAEQIERWVELRMTRQQVLDRDDPPQLAVILDEAVLRRTIGGSRVQAGQLRHLAGCATLPNIDVRVLPFGAGAHASPQGAFSVLLMAEPFPEVAHVEGPAGAVYIETPNTDRFLRTYDRLWEAGLAADESAELISNVAEELQ